MAASSSSTPADRPPSGAEPSTAGALGPVPEDNTPGHHPEREADKPDLDAFAAKLRRRPRSRAIGEKLADPDPELLEVAEAAGRRRAPLVVRVPAAFLITGLAATEVALSATHVLVRSARRGLGRLSG